MKRYLLAILVVFFGALPQMNGGIDVSQLDRFKSTLIELNNAHSKHDSINIIDQYYINSPDKDVYRFFKSKQITALSIFECLKNYPKFYDSLIHLKIDTTYLADTLTKINKKLREHFRHFRKPDIHLVVGNLSVGGSVFGNDLFICVEMVSDNGIKDKTELPKSLREITAKANLLTYICHESIHTLQTGFPLSDVWGMIRHKKNSLLNSCIVEGSADYIIYSLFGMNLNEGLRAYVNAHSTELWIKFRKDLDMNPFQYNDWIYNFTPKDGRPPDLGYFLGFLICESYVNNQQDQEKALKKLVRRGKYTMIYRKSEYSGQNRINRP